MLYVSPHSDDVAFSCAAQVARDVEAGARVAVLTLFEAPQGEGPFADQAARRAEDDRYLESARVERLAGGWADAIVRHKKYRAPRKLLSPLGAGDEQALIEAVRARLQALVDGGVARVMAPLGVGHHVDHQIASAAARALRGVEVQLYEDTPYVLTRYQLPRRLARLGLGATVSDDTLERGTVRQELQAVARAWLDAPFLRALVGPRLRKMAVASILPPELLRWPRRSRAASVTVTPLVVAGPRVVERKLAAIACYQSQWPLFYPSLDDWRAALDDYGRRAGHAGAVERAWPLPSP